MLAVNLGRIHDSFETCFGNLTVFTSTANKPNTGILVRIKTYTNVFKKKKKTLAMDTFWEIVVQ